MPRTAGARASTPPASGCRAHGGEIAEALAERLAQIEPRAADDDEAQLAPFADPNVAARISQHDRQRPREPGARDVTAAHREGEAGDVGRLHLPAADGRALRSADHPLANREFLFPFASVVEVTPRDARCPKPLGPTLVVTRAHAGRGADPTAPRLAARGSAEPRRHPDDQISWDQPHEGNLFEHLYARRAFQRAGVGSGA